MSQRPRVPFALGAALVESTGRYDLDSASAAARERMMAGLLRAVTGGDHHIDIRDLAASHHLTQVSIQRAVRTGRLPAGDRAGRVSASVTTPDDYERVALEAVRDELAEGYGETGERMASAATARLNQAPLTAADIR